MGNVEAMYRHEHPRLWRSLVAFTGDTELASDAESEAFTQLIARGDEVRDPSAWVWKSAYRIASGYLAAGRRDRGDATAEESLDDPPLIELLSLLAELTDQQRACVVLRYVGRFTGPEIAELLNTSPGTVRVQLHRAHEILRRTLEPS